MKRFTIYIFCALLVFASSVSVRAQIGNLIKITPLIGLKFYSWGEYDNNSTQNLDESGTQFLIGFSAKHELIGNMNFYVRSDFYYYTGTVDYDGYLQNDYGGNTPYKTETGYNGFELLINSGYNFNVTHNLSLAPELGLEYEHWKRDLGKGDKHGYLESYNVFFIDFGFNGRLKISPNVSIFMKFLGEAPLSISEGVDLSSNNNLKEIDLAPKSNMGINFETGVTAYNASFSFYIDYLLFSPSDINQSIFQPESDRSIFGIKLAYDFYFNI